MLGQYTLTVAALIGMIFYTILIFCITVSIKGDGKKLLFGIPGTLSIVFLLELLSTYWPW